MSERIVGFISEYDDGTYSIWGVELAPEDEEAIEKILLKYQSDGVSVRGSIDDISFKDVF